MSITGETTLKDLRDQMKNGRGEFYDKLDALLNKDKRSRKTKYIPGIENQAFDFFMVFVLGGNNTDISKNYEKKYYNLGVWSSKIRQFLFGTKESTKGLEINDKVFSDDKFKILSDYKKLLNTEINCKGPDGTNLKKIVINIDHISKLDKVYNYFTSESNSHITLGELRKQILDEGEKGKSDFGQWIVKKTDEYKEEPYKKNALLFLISLILRGVSTGKANDNPTMARVKFVTLGYTTNKENWNSVKEFLGFLKNSDEIFRNERKNNMPNHNNLQHIDDKITLSCLSNFDSDTDKKLDFKVKDLFFNKDIDDPESKLGISTISEDDKEKRIQLLRDICKDLIEELGGTGMNNNGKGDNSENKDVTDIIEGSIINHNQVIFTGAPGTGKTYSVRKYVKKPGEERYKFVQFHPSYDYTDFIEGLRPVKIGNSDEPTFVRMDGVFKKFCRQIVEDNLKTIFDKDKKEDLNSSMVELVHDLFELIVSIKEVLKDDTLDDKGNEIEKIFDNVNDKNSFLKNIDNNEISKTKDNIKKNNKITINDISSLIKSCNDFKEDKENSLISLINLDFETNDNSDTSDDKQNEKQMTWYYFVVDEVNRADLSKVFGEIMFGLEESYRGIENRFDTQYMNLNTFEVDEKDGKAEPMKFDCFKNGFFIPRNLKFIGTMNDIDRSVESFDFALRRRFHWIDIKANEVMLESLKSILKKNNVNEDKIKELAQKVKAMNEVISGDLGKKLGLSDAYHIGPAYFKKYDEKNNTLDNIFKNNIDSILREYTRGRKEEDIKNLIKCCGGALGVDTSYLDSNKALH